MIARDHLQVTETLAALQSRGDHYTRQLLQEKQRVAQYHTQLKEIQNEISRVREENKQKAVDLLNKYTNTNSNAYQRVDGLDPTRLAEENQKKLMSSLEGRLNKALIRNNTLQSENNAIKEKINELRRKKVNDIRKTEELCQSLVQTKEDINDIMKKASIVAENRDRILELQIQLEQTNQEERKRFQEEYKKLSIYIEEQNELLQTSITKAASSVVMKLQNAVTTSHNISDKDNEIQENIIDKRLEELEQQYALQKASLQDENTKFHSYEEEFHILQQVSGLSSTEEIVEAYNKNEEESFSLFTYIQTVNQDCDRLLEEKNRLEADLKHIRDISDNTEGAQRVTIEKYQSRLDQMQLEKNKLSISVDESTKMIETISKTVNELFLKLKCKDLEDAEEICLEESHEMDIGCKKNILKQMGCLEKRIIQIISVYAQHVAGKPKRRPTVLLSPKMFNRRSIHTANASDETDKSMNDDDDDSDNDDSDAEDSLGDRPISVQDMRKQHADKMKNPLSLSNVNEKVELAKSFFRDTSMPSTEI